MSNLLRRLTQNSGLPRRPLADLLLRRPSQDSLPHASRFPLRKGAEVGALIGFIAGHLAACGVPSPEVEVTHAYAALGAQASTEWQAHISGPVHVMLRPTRFTPVRPESLTIALKAVGLRVCTPCNSDVGEHSMAADRLMLGLDSIAADGYYFSVVYANSRTGSLAPAARWRVDCRSGACRPTRLEVPWGDYLAPSCCI